MTGRSVQSLATRGMLVLEAALTLADAQDRLTASGRDAAVVVRRGRVVGLLLAEDLDAAQPSRATTLSVGEVTAVLMTTALSTIMRRDVETIVPETPLAEAARLIRETGAPVVVMAGDRPVDLVTERDLLVSLASEELSARHGQGLRGPR